MTTLENFSAILQKGGMDNDTLSKFMAIMNLEDTMFNAMYPEVSANIKASAQDKSLRDEMIQQIRNAPEINIEEEKTAIEDVIKDIQADESLSENKRAFLCDIMRLMTNVYTDVIENPREKIKVQIEKIVPEARLPEYAHLTDAGADIFAVKDVIVPAGETMIIGTGIKMAIPKGYAVFLYPRSGMSLKTKMRIANSVGVIDSSYHKEIGIIFDNNSNEPYTIHAGDRIGQFIIFPVPMIEWEEATIEDTDRGGFGSTGK